MLTWDDLAARALAHQFGGGGLESLGPMQSQTARAAFLGLAARDDLTYDEIAAAYRDGALVRGSNIRGTVHTSTPAAQRVLDAVSRIGLRRMWESRLGLAGLGRDGVEDLWSAIDDFASQWRTPPQIASYAASWLSDRGLVEAAETLVQPQGRFLSVSIGLVRRPVKGDWAGQGAPEYRAAAVETGLALPKPEAAVEQAILLHVRAHGPSSREDIAWWSGLPLRVVSVGIERLGDRVVSQPGPLDRTYVDLPDARSELDLHGVRLLPEFDALLCAYDSKARDRFVSPEQHRLLFNQANGLCRPPVLVDGRIGGVWRATGSAKRRPLEISYFAGTRRPTQSEVTEAVARVERGLGITITGVTITRG